MYINNQSKCMKVALFENSNLSTVTYKISLNTQAVEKQTGNKCTKDLRRKKHEHGGIILLTLPYALET